MAAILVDEARQLFHEYEPVVRDFVYYDKTLPADDKSAYLALVSLIHNHRRHDVVHVARQKHPLFVEFVRFNNTWKHRKQALKDPTCRSLVRVSRGSLSVRKIDNMKGSRVGYILSCAEMERLMRRAQRAKQEFVRNEQTGDGLMSLGTC